MKNLKRLGVAIALTLVLGVSALAGETPAGPCAPPDPGEVSSPPCSVAQITTDDSVVPGDTNGPPASNATSAPSVTEVALAMLQSVLSLF